MLNAKSKCVIHDEPDGVLQMQICLLHEDKLDHISECSHRMTLTFIPTSGATTSMMFLYFFNFNCSLKDENMITCAACINNLHLTI